jgi:hypothetical protein
MPGDVATLFAAAPFLLWPAQYRWSMRRVKARLVERGGDVARFEDRMDRRPIRVALVAVPLMGVVLIASVVLSLVV